MTSRLQKLRQSFDELEIDAMLVTDEINVRYLSGFTGDSSYLLIAPDGIAMLSDGRYTTQLAAECPDIEAVIRFSDRQMIDLVDERINSLGKLRIGFEAALVSVATFQQWQEKCPHAVWVPAIGAVETLRAIKDAGEIAKIRRAIDIAQRAYLSVVPRFRPQWTEIEIAHELEAAMRALGGEGVSFPPIIGTALGAALPHYRPVRTPLADQTLLLMDFGAKFEGYASDITRTLGAARASSEFRRAHAAVLQAQLAAIDCIRPGVATKDVDTAARDVLKKQGFGEAFMHGLGHGIGLQIHEAPRLGATSKEVLAAGMVITVEPGVYFAGDFGIRIEDDVLVTETGCEVLTSLPKGLDECPLLL